jgi:hypothetical protein
MEVLHTRSQYRRTDQFLISLDAFSDEQGTRN